MEFTTAELKTLLTGPGHMTEADFDMCCQIAEKERRNVAEVIVEKEFLRDEQLGRLMAEAKGYAFIDLHNEKIDESVLKMIPEVVARSKKVIAFARDNGAVRIGMVNPGDLGTKHILEKRFGLDIKTYCITEADCRRGLIEYKASLEEEAGQILKIINERTSASTDKEESNIRLVDLMLKHGHYNHASDIHVETYKESVAIRFRIDGVMHTALRLPVALAEVILSRIKILSRMRIDEHLAAQDGRFEFEASGERVDVRVSIVPVTKGENIVMRLLSAKQRELSLEMLGFAETDMENLRQAIDNPHGMILVTGQTGCGKTTTIYEILKTLNTDQVHIASIEDPVEYDIEGISQIQVNPKTNLTFAKGLRAIVRQDPDIIFVGEIRDNETAAIAVNSALTGHLVLSTLHANDAATTLPRLLDMGIEPFLIASTIRLVIAQRLVRKICEKCRASYALDEAEMTIIRKNSDLARLFKIDPKGKTPVIRLFRGNGCKVCSQSGYSGRLGIFEMIGLRPEIKRLILDRASSDDVRLAADSLGLPTMLEDGVRKALAGLTTLEEVLRVVEIKR